MSDEFDNLSGVERVGEKYVNGQLGRRMRRLPCGTVKVDWVRIVDDPEDPAVKNMPSLWPDWLDEIFNKPK